MQYEYHTLDVNGIDYESIPPKTNSKMLNKLNQISMVMGGRNIGLGRPQVDQAIYTEYCLIQLKKSNMSASKRRWVVHTFEQSYRKIDTSVYYEILDGRKLTVANTKAFLERHDHQELISEQFDFTKDMIVQCKAFLERSKSFIPPTETDAKIPENIDTKNGGISIGN